MSTESPTRQPRFSGGQLMAIIIVAVAAITVVASLAIVTHRSTAAPTTTTIATASLPRISICAYDGARYKPTSLSWCTSACSDYITNLSWTSWTAQSATALGTLVTNDGVPSCANGTLTHHPNYLVVFGVPQQVTVCQGQQTVTRLLFTQSNLWGQQWSLPLYSGTCS